jgi:hypothetical protein
MTLSTFPIEVRGKKTLIAQDLAEQLKSHPRNLAAIIEDTALTIYGIRSNLFHGKYDLGSELDREHVRLAERLLSKLIRELLAKEMLGHALPTAEFAAEHQVAL